MKFIYSSFQKLFCHSFKNVSKFTTALLLLYHVIFSKQFLNSECSSNELTSFSASFLCIICFVFSIQNSVVLVFAKCLTSSKQHSRALQSQSSLQLLHDVIRPIICVLLEVTSASNIKNCCKLSSLVRVRLL